MQELNQTTLSSVSGGAFLPLIGVGVSLVSGFAGGTGSQTSAFASAQEYVPAIPADLMGVSVAATGAVIGTSFWLAGNGVSAKSLAMGAFVNGVASAVTYLGSQHSSVTSLY